MPLSRSSPLGDRGPTRIWCRFVFHEHSGSGPDDARDLGPTHCIWALVHVEPQGGERGRREPKALLMS